MDKLLYETGLLLGLIIVVPTAMAAAFILAVVSSLSEITGVFGHGILRAIDVAHGLVVEEDKLVLGVEDD